MSQGPERFNAYIFRGGLRILRAMRVLLILSALVLAVQSSRAAAPSNLSTSWPQWRGPIADGSSAHANPPTEWSESKNIRWKISLPGKGHSTPIILGDRIYLLAAAPVGEALPAVHDSAPGVHDSIPVTHRHQYMVIALSRADGRTLWKTVVREEFPHEGGHTTGSPISNSPVTDGKHIYAFFGSRGLYCLDLDGKILWKKDLGKMQTLHAHGEGSSPVLHGDTLVVNWDHERDSFLHAFNKHTGEELWKVRRDEITSWSTPLIVEVDGKPQVLVSATKRIRGYDLATGTQIWECAGLTDNVVSSPVFHRGILIAGVSYTKQAMLGIRVSGARGDITGSNHVIWHITRNTPYVPSPLLHNDILYVIRHNQNVLGRLDPMTGKLHGELYRLEGIRDFIFSSPVAGGDRIYITGRDGSTVVLRPSSDPRKDPEILSVNRLNDSFSASAALVGRELYLRGESFLYCISETSSAALN